jgi:uncharacterized protein with von Willebrand factor type A (vWA) domain
VSAAFSAQLATFTATLREEHGFGVGQRETHDALRAAECVGITDLHRVRGALRLIYCASPGESARFDAAFDAFFRGPHGVAQPSLDSAAAAPALHARENNRDAGAGEIADAARARRSAAVSGETANAWEIMRRRYSAAAGRAEAPTIPTEGLDAMLAAVRRLVAAVRIAPSRRWLPDRNGPRPDLRRTLRASLETGGDPIVLRRRGRTPRSARFVVLIDGSRSMTEHAAPLLQFAHALCRHTPRAHAFVFSTELRDVTKPLREPDRPGRPLDDLGESWGGGTRIGASLAGFAERYGPRLLSAETIVFVASDGLDVGEIDRLERAMRTLRGRSAALIWLHPHAGVRGFTPSARGMRAALPYLDALVPAGGATDLVALAQGLRPQRRQSL